MGQVNCREDFHKDIYRGAIELFISFPFRVTKTCLGSTFNLLARELSIVTSLCPSSRILKPVGDSKMLQLHLQY